MLDNLVTPIVAIAVILGITFPIWLLVLAARFVRNVGRIASSFEQLMGVYWSERIKELEPGQRRVSNSMFGR